VNPDALIARTNLSRPEVDVAYLASLGNDAVPTLVRRLPALPAVLQEPLALALVQRGAAKPDPLAWNASRSHARALLAEHRAELLRYARIAR
jgi:hypothetical protein